jgi:hypothetical protein
MMGLKFVEIKEFTEEVRGWEAEATLKVSNKNHELTGFGYGFHLVTRNPARNLRRNLPRAV